MLLETGWLPIPYFPCNPGFSGSFSILLICEYHLVLILRTGPCIHDSEKWHNPEALRLQHSLLKTVIKPCLVLFDIVFKNVNSVERGYSKDGVPFVFKLVFTVS